MNLNDYLNQNISNQREITNTTSFYDKFNALSELYSQINNSDNRKILRSQGKYNSKICMIFKNEQHFKDSTSALNRVFEVYGIKMWDILVLYQDKLDSNNDNIYLLLKELLIVNPMIVYIFDNDSLESDLLNICNKDVILGCMFINVNNICNILDNSIKVFDLFEYLITYNY